MCCSRSVPARRDTLANDDFKVLVKDITLHIAASAPVSVSRDEVDPELVAKEKAIAEEQAVGKPPQAIEKIVTGKMNKFFATNCLLEQGFVKNPDISIKDHVASVAQSARRRDHRGQVPALPSRRKLLSGGDKTNHPSGSRARLPFFFGQALGQARKRGFIAGTI